VAFARKVDFNFFRHAIIPILGLIVNVVMVIAIFVIGFMSGGATAQSTALSLWIGGGWLLISVLYFVISSSKKGQAILPSAHEVVDQN
jgi:hypothetical protein